MKNWRKISLEVSLKPFMDLTDSGIRSTAAYFFNQWRYLLDHAQEASLLFWASDGSEILDYAGQLEDRLEWAKWIGVANAHGATTDTPPEEQSIHELPRPYRPNAPELTYGDLKRILTVCREVFQQLFGRPLKLGATLDSGPEFAVSDFKYRRHPEICRGFSLGGKSFVCCYASLHEDSRRYAGFPNGIPEGTSFGTFLGKQATHYLKDMGFDYLWLSNGLGFGMETWGVCGALFDGVTFATERMDEIQEKMLGFWEDFRRECPDIPLETRGTNLTSGIDLATDGTSAQGIYRQVQHMQAPVNSPWAALNGDFGMELAGWLSHVAELPSGSGFPFRLYIHDPWFVNSPWFDRYGRSPHDIYLPLSCARLNEDGQVQAPDSCNLLTVEDSYGAMPDTVPLEVTHYIHDARETVADAPGPLVWVYPFAELTDRLKSHQRDIFAEDYLMRGAINLGFPLNTVVSFRNAVAWEAQLRGQILVVPALCEEVPEVLDMLTRHVQGGGRAILYGPVHTERLRRLLGLQSKTPLAGEVRLEGKGIPPQCQTRHLPLVSAGPLDCATTSSEGVLADYVQGGERRTAALLRALGRGHLLWIRGTNSFEMRQHAQYPTPFPESCFRCESFFRSYLSCLGYDIQFLPAHAHAATPCLTLRRHANALYLAGYAQDTTGNMALSFPDGAPVFSRQDALLKDNRTVYHCQRAVNLEARIFVSGEDGHVTCKDVPLTYPGIQRRMVLEGVRRGTVVFRPPETEGITYSFTRKRDEWPPRTSLWTTDALQAKLVTDELGPKFVLEQVDFPIYISWGKRHQPMP